MPEHRRRRTRAAAQGHAQAAQRGVQRRGLPRADPALRAHRRACWSAWPRCRPWRRSRPDRTSSPTAGPARWTCRLAAAVPGRSGSVPAGCPPGRIGHSQPGRAFAGPVLQGRRRPAAGIVRGQAQKRQSQATAGRDGHQPRGTPTARAGDVGSGSTATSPSVTAGLGARLRHLDRVRRWAGFGGAAFVAGRPTGSGSGPGSSAKSPLRPGTPGSR